MPESGYPSEPVAASYSVLIDLLYEAEHAFQTLEDTIARHHADTPGLTLTQARGTVALVCRVLEDESPDDPVELRLV